MSHINRLSILGSTGSIGTQALDVAARHRDRISVEALVAYSNIELLTEQIRQFKPKIAGLIMPPDGFSGEGFDCEWVFGEEALTAAATLQSVTDVLVSVTGLSGLGPTLEAIKAKKRILIANKEALVAGGKLIMEEAKANGVTLIPIDGEHSAIFQCLQCAGQNRPTRLTITASGGPFRKTPIEDMKKATVEDALLHPNWLMGKKITVDCATLMNKGLEIIEAHWLFGMGYEDIEAVIHPQSIVHSAVHFEDGTTLAQMSWPDMRVPILYALLYPDRKPTGCGQLDLIKAGSLTFEPLDTERFPCFELAVKAYTLGELAPAVLNAANEEAVSRFLKGGMPITSIADVVADVMRRPIPKEAVSLDAVLRADRYGRGLANEAMEKLGFDRII